MTLKTEVQAVKSEWQEHGFATDGQMEYLRSGMNTRTLAMLDRVAILSSEIDANEEENREMQKEITAIYAIIDAS